MKICKSVSLFFVSLLSLFGCTDEKKNIYHFSGEEWNFGYINKDNKCSFTMDNACVTFEFVFSDVSWGKRITIDGVTITDIFINNVVVNDNEIYCDQNYSEIYYSFSENHNIVSFKVVNYNYELKYSVSVDEAPSYGQPLRIAILFNTEQSS